MQIEIQYIGGKTFQINIPDEAIRNNAACVLDDDSVMVSVKG